MTPSLPPTISPQQAREIRWDAIVVGAGIAGSLTALQLARRGRKTLLIERQRLPRGKVCGACLNPDAISSFRKAGVWQRIEALGGHWLNGYELRCPGRRATLTLPGGHAVSRPAMDTVLAAAAIEAGAAYLDTTPVTLAAAENVATYRRVVDKRGNAYCGSVIVAANGFSTVERSNSGDHVVDIASDSRVGLSAEWPLPADERLDDGMLAPGTIYMAVGPNGYVGLVVTEGGRVNLAAAVDRVAVQASSPAQACDQILTACGWKLTDALRGVRFHGTAAMTRQRRVAGGHRLLFIGDASGYVEPFTGEGMAWAAASALSAGSLVDQAIESWHESCPLIWTKNLRILLGGRQRRCKWISRLLRYPTLARYTIGTLSAFPTLGQFAVRTIQQEQSCDMLDRRPGNRGADTGGHAA